MKNTAMFSNREALERGNARAKWKVDITMNYFRGVSYPKDRITVFDFRDMYSLIPLIIDIDSVIDRPEEEQREYFINELKQIEDAFVFSRGAVPGMPDPERIKPYIRRLYETIATNYDIDWDNESQIENLFCSMLAQQAIGTMVEKFPKEIFELFPTKEQSTVIDNISLTSFNNIGRLRNLIAMESPELLRNIGATSSIELSHGYNITSEVNRAISEATASGSGAIVIDPATSDITKMHFLGEKFTVNDLIPMDMDDPNSFPTYNEDEAIKDFYTSIISTYGRTINEYMSVSEAYGNQEANKGHNLVFINGRSIKDIFAEKEAEENTTGVRAVLAVGRMLRDAMTDGESVVSIMRPSITAEGKAVFKHQEIKVDLDKLNRIDRNERHNAFRRMLDYFGIWKIKPRFATNEARDAKQAEAKSKPEYKQAMRAAEDKFVSSYNELAKDRRPIDRLYNAFPEITKEENANEREIENQAIENEPVRENIIVHEIANEERNIHVEPIREDEEQVLQAENSL